MLCPGLAQSCHLRRVCRFTFDKSYSTAQSHSLQDHANVIKINATNKMTALILFKNEHFPNDYKFTSIIVSQ